jgi:hypothetical protein
MIKIRWRIHFVPLHNTIGTSWHVIKSEHYPTVNMETTISSLLTSNNTRQAMPEDEVILLINYSGDTDEGKQ